MRQMCRMTMAMFVAAGLLLSACGSEPATREAEPMPATTTAAGEPTAIAVTETPVPDANTLTPKTAPNQAATELADTGTPTSTPTPQATRTPAPKATATRRVPTVPLKFGPDGTPANNGDFQLDASISDPNYTPEGMSALAFLVSVKVVDPDDPKAKVNSVDFAVYGSEEDYQNKNSPLYVHTEKSAPFCIFGDSNGRCATAKAQRSNKWPQSDQDDVERVAFADGTYILDVIVHAGKDSGMFWQGAVEFNIKTQR